MKKLFILLPLFISLFLNNNSFAQQKLTDFKVSIPRPYEAWSATDNPGSSAYIFQNYKNYEIDFLDAEFKVERTVIVEKIKADKNQKILGAVLENEFCIIYLYNKKLKAFSSLLINRSTGESDFSRFHISNSNEQFLRAFEMNGKFYVMFVPKKNNAIKLLVLQGNKMEEMTINVEMPQFYGKLSAENDFMNKEAESEVGIEEINYFMENNVRSSYPRKKLYHYDDKIYLSFDDPNLTHLVIIDPATQKSYYKKLNFNLEEDNNSSEKKGNSFMYKNRLFRATISPGQLNISILDLDSMSLINSYNFYPGKDINILNGAIIQEGGSPSLFTEEKALKKTEQFFRKVLNGNLAIAVSPTDSNNYEIQLGSYEIFNNSPRLGSGFGMPGLSVGIGMGMGMGSGMGMGMGPGMGMGMGYPYGGGYPGNYSNQNPTALRVVYFKSLLDNQDFRHVEGNIPVNMREKIYKYEVNSFGSNIPEVKRISTYKNNFLLGYYTKSEKKFTLVEFRK